MKYMIIQVDHKAYGRVGFLVGRLGYRWMKLRLKDGEEVWVADNPTSVRRVG